MSAQSRAGYAQARGMGGRQEPGLPAVSAGYPQPGEPTDNGLIASFDGRSLETTEFGGDVTRVAR